MDKNVQRMYGIMGLIGEVLAAVSIYLAISGGILQKIDFAVLLGAVTALMIAGIVLFELKRHGRFQSVSMLNAAIAKGHIAMMLGVCALITAMMSRMEKPFFDTLAIVIIVIVFLSVMLGFMIKTFAKFMDMVKESEK